MSAFVELACAALIVALGVRTAGLPTPDVSASMRDMAADDVLTLLGIMLSVIACVFAVASAVAAAVFVLYMVDKLIVWLRGMLVECEASCRAEAE